MLPALQPVSSQPVPAGLRRAAEGFEQMFLGQLLRDYTVGAVGAGGEGSEVFADMLQDEYARLLVRNGGVGIAEIDVEHQPLERFAPDLIRDRAFRRITAHHERPIDQRADAHLVKQARFAHAAFPAHKPDRTPPFACFMQRRIERIEFFLAADELRGL